MVTGFIPDTVDFLFTLERYISRFMYRTGVRLLSKVIHNDTIQYDLAYCTSEHFIVKKLKIKSLKINFATLIVTLLTVIVTTKETNETNSPKY